MRYSGSTAHGVVVRWNWRALVTGATFTDGTLQRGSLNLGTVRWPGANSTALLAKSSPYQSPQWWGSVLMNMQDASGQLYRRNRYYDPATGRFTQEDPIGLAGGLNLYGFGGGDPVNYADPMGLKVEFANAQSRQMWNNLRELVRLARQSGDRNLIGAANKLGGMMRDLEAADGVFRLDVRALSKSEIDQEGAAYTDGTERKRRDAPPLRSATTTIDPGAAPLRHGVPNVVTLAHEIGHAWTFMKFQHESMHEFFPFDAENSARIMVGCGLQRWSHIGSLPCN